MEVSVFGKQIDIGQALRSHVELSLTGGVAKYFDRSGRAQVTFSREGAGFRCDCSVHFDAGILLQSSGEASDIYASFEAAVQRMEKRVRRYKRRLKNHHNNRRSSEEIITAPTYVIAAEQEEADEPQVLQPVIIAETTTDVTTLTVGEAVMQMDLAEAPALVFRSSVHGGINFVYRRRDGNIGWVDLKQWNSTPE